MLSKYIKEVNIHSYQSNYNTQKGHKIYHPKMNKWWSYHFQFYLLKLWYNTCNGWLFKQSSGYDLQLSSHFDTGKSITWQIRYSIRFYNNGTQKPYYIVFLFHFFVLMKGHSDEIFKSSKNSLWRTIRNSKNLKCHFDAPLRLGPHLITVIH